MLTRWRYTLVALTLVLLASTTWAQSITNTYTLSSKYVSRGVNTVNNWVLQTAASLSLGNFTVGLWGNMELTNQNRGVYLRSYPAGTFTEWNLLAEYATVMRGVNVALGWIRYDYPGQGWESTREAYLSVGMERPFSLSVTFYRDLKTARGNSWTIGGEVPLGRGWSFHMEAGYGCARYNAYYYGCQDATWTDLTLGLATEVEVGSGWRLRPTLWFSTLLDRRLLADSPHRQNLWMSLEFSRSR